MKYLSLQQAMLGMRVTMNDDGLILKSPAGSAHYDLKGRRHTVLGDASFFPEHLRVKDKRKPKGGHVSYGNGEIVGHRADGSVAWRIGKIEEPTKTPDAALGELSAVYTLPRYEISSDMKMQELIANALDEAKQRYKEVFGGFPADKTAVVFLADRWVAIEGGYTPDEIRDAVEHIKHRRLTKEFGKGLAELSPFALKDGQVFIKDAVIGNGIVSANYSVTLNVAGKGKPHASGMAVGVEGDQSKVVFEADRFKVHDAVQSIVGNAVATNAKTKIRLGDEMTQAVIDAVRESDLFTAIQVNIDAQTASVAGMQQAMHDAVNDAIRNALKPGGLLYSR